MCKQSVRRSKLGDFRRPRHGRGAQITVNRDLPPLQFLLTLTHEIAHLHAFGSHRRRIRPHGKEWKNCFAVLLRELAAVETLPHDYRNALLEHASNPRATAQQDLKLWAVLQEIEAPEGTRSGAALRGAAATAPGGPMRRRPYLCLSQVLSFSTYVISQMI